MSVPLLITLRPVNTANIWWDLSRGREVLSGSIAPSSALLSLDAHYEADWLSGLPFYFLWLIGGVLMLAAVPVVAAIVLGQYSQRKFSRQDNSLNLLFFLPLLLWSARDGLQPTSQLFDIAGMLVLVEIVRSKISQRAKGICIFLTFLVWANIGPSPIWGLILLTLFSELAGDAGRVETNLKRISPQTPSSTFRPRALRWLLLACLGGMLTPRGILTWRDSLILFSPQSFSNIELFKEQLWQGAWLQSSWSISEWAFLILWCGWGFLKILSLRKNIAQNEAGKLRFSMNSWQSVLIVLFPLLAATLSQKNIPLSGIWILIDLIHHPIEMNSVRNQEPKWIGKINLGVASLIVIAGVADAAGYGIDSHRRLGWGIARELDSRLFDGRLVYSSDQQINAWAPDGRSVGIVTWLDGNVQMVDHPQRALLGNRIESSTMLVKDLKGAHRAQYRRDNGSWGGWVRQLSDWEVSMIVIPFQMESVISELMRSPWQQVDLDSPGVPFISTNEPDYASYILEVGQQQGFVEFGPWRPTLDIYDGLGWRYDICELAGARTDPAPAIIQSKIFRAMNIPMTSLRALLPVRRGKLHGPLLDEFLACQVELAYQEWSSYGEASLFRRNIINTLSDSPGTRELPWMKLNTEEASLNSTARDRCIAYYLSGEISQAINALSGDSSSECFSRAMLQLELGETEPVLKELEQILQNKENDSLSIAATFWKQQVSQFSGQ